jgi:hypothetical protein
MAKRLYTGSPEDYRLTPDISAEPPYMMTKRQYDLHMRMLEDIDRQENDYRSHGIVYDRYERRLDDMHHDEFATWNALFRNGLARRVEHRPGIVLTKYGQLYLDQRRAPSRDRRDPRRARRRTGRRSS